MIATDRAGRSAAPGPVIDLHAHFVLPEHVAAAERAGHLRPDGMPGWPEWSAVRHMEAMDAAGIAKAMLSVPSPGVHFGDDFRARVLARRMNEAAAGVVADHPERFGFFASLPLPDAEAALAEVDHAYDVLGAAGVILLSNVGGLYPGEPSWEPLWRGLNARSATVLLHPTSPPQWRQVALDRPRAMLEFPFDTARAVTDLALSGVLARHPDLSVFPVCGEILPTLAERVDHFSGMSGALKNLTTDDFYGSGYCCPAA
ncbi:amidohydrolase family protein [Kribbella sp. NPDC026611]|uniref:amidohydrolase family protein n=1 Tax=Kribbella sp. NPDC026611 TaxID=3154911 RepID=UPI0033FCDC62